MVCGLQIEVSKLSVDSASPEAKHCCINPLLLAQLKYTCCFVWGYASGLSSFTIKSPNTVLWGTPASPLSLRCFVPLSPNARPTSRLPLRSIPPTTDRFISQAQLLPCEHFAPNPAMVPSCLLNSLYITYFGTHGLPHYNANLFFHFYLPQIPFRQTGLLFLLLSPCCSAWILSPLVEGLSTL